MKIKVRETLNTIIPKYVYTGRKNILNLNITDKFKYVILYSNITPLYIFFQTETTLIQNYSKYTIYSNSTINYSLGCSTKFRAPNYVFPSWDKKISNYTGITFGKIQIKDFFVLTNRQAGINTPNTLLSC
jgi:hypothetical protein